MLQHDAISGIGWLSPDDLFSWEEVAGEPTWLELVVAGFVMVVGEARR